MNGCFWHGHNVALPQVESSECCKIPNTRQEFWVAKIRRNQERDVETQKALAKMGWHCITIWECELKPAKREVTLKSLAYTLNEIWLKEHAVIGKPYPEMEEEGGMSIMNGIVAIEPLTPKGVDPRMKEKWLPSCLCELN